MMKLSAQMAEAVSNYAVAIVTLILNKLGFYPGTTRIRAMIPVIALNIFILASIDIKAVLEALLSYNAMM